MSTELPAAPEHADLDGRRVAELAAFVRAELPAERQRVPRRALVVAAALAVAVLVGGAYAVGAGVLDAFDLRGGGPSDPKRIGERLQVAAADEWSLQAWRSTRGICLGFVLDGEPSFSACGMPVVGAPPDTVVPQPPTTHVVGFLAGSDDRETLYVTGPTAAHVARVDVELADGLRAAAAVYDAPQGLEAPLRFYVLRHAFPAGAGPRRPPVRALLAYDAEGTLIERFEVAATRR